MESKVVSPPQLYVRPWLNEVRGNYCLNFKMSKFTLQLNLISVFKFPTQ